MTEPILQLKNIVKRFPGVKALDNVSLDVRAGEVLALVGENGAGKSTLMKIMSGIYQPDEGEIIYGGEVRRFANVNAAKACGISIIHQELNLCNNLKVYQNVYAGREIVNKLGLLDEKNEREQAQKLFDRLEMDIDADNNLGNLSVSQKQMVEISRALLDDAKILIMDEPTSALSNHEAEILFETIKNLTQSGVAVIYISHKMEEVFSISDRITVFRDGQYIGTVQTAQADTDDIIAMMVGRKMEDVYPARTIKPSEPFFEVRELCVKGLVEQVSFNLKKGEILGIYGLVGAGRSELVKTIFGAIRKDSGEVLIDGDPVDIRSPGQAIARGIGLVTENRKEEGLCLGMTVAENMTASSLKLICGALGTLNRKKEQQVAQEMATKMSVKCPSISTEVKYLSGGNQQKVVIGKWLLNSLKLLILDEPTRGIDIGAKHEIYMLMNALTEQGLSIIMISSELPEVMGMSDRIMVMREHKIVACLEKEQVSKEEIMRYIAGGKAS